MKWTPIPKYDYLIQDINKISDRKSGCTFPALHFANFNRVNLLKRNKKAELALILQAFAHLRSNVLFCTRERKWWNIWVSVLWLTRSGFRDHKCSGKSFTRVVKTYLIFGLTNQKFRRSSVSRGRSVQNEILKFVSQKLNLREWIQSYFLLR